MPTEILATRTETTMIESVVALIMFVGAEIKEARLQENMALNKVNIEFLRGQMDKVLNDIEKLKDANREIGYKNGSYSQ